MEPTETFPSSPQKMNPSANDFSSPPTNDPSLGYDVSMSSFDGVDDVCNFDVDPNAPSPNDEATASKDHMSPHDETDIVPDKLTSNPTVGGGKKKKVRRHCSTAIVSPIRGMRLQKGIWITRVGSIASSEEVMFNRVLDYVRTEAAKDFCVDVYGHERKCSCIHELRTSESLLRNCANSLLQDYHALPTPEAKTRYVLDKKRHAEAHEAVVKSYTKKVVHRKYLVPSRSRSSDEPLGVDGNDNGDGNGDDGEETPEYVFLCVWGFFKLHSIGQHHYQRIIKTDPEAPIASSGLVGNRNSTKRLDEAFLSIHEFLDELKDRASEADPTCVRTTKKRGSDETSIVVMLPPHMKYRQLYRTWCFRRGWIPKLKCKKNNVYLPWREWDPRPNDDDAIDPEWPTGTVAKKVVSWASFMNYWRANFTDLEVDDPNRHQQRRRPPAKKPRATM